MNFKNRLALAAVVTATALVQIGNCVVALPEREPGIYYQFQKQKYTDKNVTVLDSLSILKGENVNKTRDITVNEDKIVISLDRRTNSTRENELHKLKVTGERQTEAGILSVVDKSAEVIANQGNLKKTQVVNYGEGKVEALNSAGITAGMNVTKQEDGLNFFDTYGVEYAHEVALDDGALRGGSTHTLEQEKNFTLSHGALTGVYNLTKGDSWEYALEKGPLTLEVNYSRLIDVDADADSNRLGGKGPLHLDVDVDHVLDVNATVDHKKMLHDFQKGNIIR